MKKLTGMKNNFSSLENKRLQNLNKILGGQVDGGATAINYVETNKGDCPDKETWKDHKLVNTLIVGDC
ncbi:MULTISPECIES: TIGR04139 family peptide modification target [Chryseobacterium]|uniref:Peptide modification target (TIGR04139 family) n=1 Tax=Chryseobacterium camelliae TaxID=1265445 RepID=A0ABU0THC6_9FLAO|nr:MULTISPECIES: TIGR04139 family peptide modification target [Chryseobacterium]MDT3405739.1 putative peptide modification target (TIGR04139 family) [Pseudacidovorax intermedius]MDQ1096452.1 putative peptide modification target (TIGR04139 family) [Chryseobacterium camelliae]MDQ1100393.1 putative peptide modification target (TIGR04139 family) [Chryseobacterium sp. SORGH_AS_1048]MDR6087734.1 putative peptide modification target (TIGR04139 family) [Chryseobacterium sp. SORGH_AS_0909]MDR6132110.1 